MASSFMKEKLKMISISLCILSLLFMGLSQVLSWFVLDADKNIGGLADINLKADFYEARVDFTATAQVEAGGLGGMIGGIADLGSVTSEGNITISDDIYYYEGLERLQGVIGVLFDTTKNADYSVNLQTWNSTNTWVWVNTHTDLIPWWPEGIGQDITITIKLNQSDNVKHVRINKIWIDIYTDWNEADRRYTTKSSKAWEIEPGDYLYRKDEEKVYKHAVAIEKEWGDKIGIITMVDLTMTDNQNETDIVQVRPFTSTSHPQKMVNIRPISQGQFISIVLMFVSFPMTIVAIILTIVALILTILKKRRRKHFMVLAGIFELLSVIFFVNGANTLIGLIGFLNEGDYYWNISGLLIPIIAGVLLLVAFILEMIYRPKKEPEKEVRFKIEGLAEEEAEPSEGLDEGEEEEFQCPQCGKVFEELVSTCPDCGAEFEGVEEGEEEIEEELEKELDEEAEGEVEPEKEAGGMGTEKHDSKEEGDLG